MNKLLLLALLLLPAFGNAQIYKTTDEQGNVSYSDVPANGAPSKPVELHQLNTAPPPPDMPTPPPEQTREVPAAAEYSLSIVAPANETSIPRGPGNFSVSVSLSPSLEQGALLQLYLDGAPWGDPQTASNWSLTNVFRGAHDLTVAVTDGKGRQLSVSEPVRVYVHRPSVNF